MDLHVYHHFDPAALDPRLDQVLTVLAQLRLEIKTMSQTLKAATDALAAEVAADTTVMQSAVTLIGGIGAQITAAVNAAIAAGATPEQVQPITDAVMALTVDRAQLAAAVEQNTTAA